jgi:hypothetical protein
MKLPRTSVVGFERLGRSLYRLRRVFRITDIDSLLQALEWVPVRAEQSLEEANVVCGHGTPPTFHAGQILAILAPRAISWPWNSARRSVAHN